MQKIKRFRPGRRLVLAAEIEKHYSRRNPRIVPHEPSPIEGIVVDMFHVIGVVGRDLYVRQVEKGGEFSAVIFEQEVACNIRRGDLLFMSIVWRRQYEEWEVWHMSAPFV